MEYHLRYAEGAELRGAVKRGVKRMLRAAFIIFAAVWVLVAAAGFGAAVWMKEVSVAVGVAAGVLTLAGLLVLRAFLMVREAAGGFLPQGGEAVTLTTTESGLLIEMPAFHTRSFYLWNTLRLLPLRAGDGMLCMVDAASGSALLLPLHGLSAEDSTALHAAFAAAIAAAKQETATAAPLPPPDGFGESGVACTPAALTEGYDRAGWLKYHRRFAVGACLTTVVLLLLWAEYGIVQDSEGAGFLSLLCLFSLIQWCRLLRHPGRRLLRQMRRFVKDNTYAWNTDGTAVLIRRPSGAWAVFPLSLAEKAYQGEHSCVLQLQKKNCLVLPRELPPPAALPVQPARHRLPRWAKGFVVMLVLSTAVAGYLWYHAPAAEEAQDESLIHETWQQFVWPQFDTSSDRASAADADTAARYLREGADEWVAFETGWHRGSSLRQQVFRSCMAVSLYVWGNHFPEQWQAVKATMPAEAQAALQEEQDSMAEILEEWAEQRAQSERFMAAVSEAQRTEERRAAAATEEDADAAICELLEAWLAARLREEAWQQGEAEMPDEEEMNNRLLLSVRLNVWQEQFPLPFFTACMTLPEAYRAELLEADDEDEEEDPAEDD